MLFPIDAEGDRIHRIDGHADGVMRRAMTLEELLR